MEGRQVRVGEGLFDRDAFGGVESKHAFEEIESEGRGPGEVSGQLHLRPVAQRSYVCRCRQSFIRIEKKKKCGSISRGYIAWLVLSRCF